MNLGKLRRRLIVTGRDETAAVVRTRGDEGELEATSRRTAAPKVADDELPPLRVIDGRDDTGSAPKD